MRKHWTQFLPYYGPAAEGAGAAGDGAAGNGDGSQIPSGDAAAAAGASDAKPSAADLKAGTLFAGKPADGEKPANGDAGNDDQGDGKKRPEGVPEKFWNAEAGEIRVDDLVKAYGTLETAHTKLKTEKGYGKAGESEGDYFKDGFKPTAELKNIREIDGDNDPAVKVFRQVALKHKLPPEVAASIAYDFLAELDGHMPAPIDPEAERAKLGDNAKNVIDATETWVDGLYDNGLLSADEFQALAGLASTASGVRVLAKLRQVSGEAPIPLGDPVGDELPSVDEWYAMHRDDRYQKGDPAFVRKVEEIGAKLFPNGTSPSSVRLAGVGVPPPRAFDRRERSAPQR